MKQIAQNYKSGELIVLDVPAPSCRPGGVLVRSLFSLISTGTEMMKLTEAKLSMVGKARARPDQLKKVLDSVTQQGAVSTYKKVMNRLDSYTPLGYSLCGVVTEVGRGAEEFRVGQLVAAAGNEYALHAEYNWVPVNLCVPVPASVSAEHAAFATVGAIAMQGVRRAEVQLGDAACVIGLGLVGQLAVRLLVAAGVRVVGLDTIEDRCRLAEKAGALLCAAPTEDGLAAIQHALGEITEGRGADHVLLAAGGSSNGPVEAAARLARDRARVVDIGKTRLDLPWNAYYDKELDVRFSRSYGPGRYDDRYELDGIDYPAGYVRWTERRNLGCFLDLLAHADIEVDSLVSGVFPMERATEVYSDLAAGSLNAVGVLLEYSAGEAGDQAAAASQARQSVGRQPVPGKPAGSAQRRPTGKQLAVGFIGAGNYASSMLLPHLAKLDEVRLAHVATTRSLSAVNAQRKFGFAVASTTADAVLGDDELDVIFIVTRHHTHASLVCRALETGKAVFVEKPLALSRAELERIEETVASTGNDRLMVGFNRRFAPLLTTLKAEFAQQGIGSISRYLINAGQLESGSWYRDSDLEGSRFAGEGGHFIDTLSWWAGSLPEEVFAVPGLEADELQATVRFSGGSSGIITYTTTGNARYPKETLDASGGGRTARLDNFRQATIWTGRRRSVTKARGVRTRASAPGRCVRRRLQDRVANAHNTGLTAGNHEGDYRCRREPGERQTGANMTAISPSRLLWYGRRVARMSPAELVWRARDQAVRAAWSRHQVGRDQRAADAPLLSQRPRFSVVLPPDAAAKVPEPAVKALLAAADELLRGEWEVLGATRTDMALPDWFLDPVTGVRAPAERYAFRINHRSQAVTGNIKQIWEISRLQHLTLLAAAWFVSRDDVYARRVAEQLRSWWRENPFLSGVNWTSGIEAGLRLISMAWIRRLMNDWPEISALFEQDELALRQIRWHQQYLDAFCSRGSSANNHVIAEAAGQLVASCAFGWFPESETWRRKSARLLELELDRNTFPSGIDRELASEYQSFVAELGLLAAIESGSAGHPLSSEVWQRLCAMVDSGAALLDERMRPPRQGDGDEGRALLLDAPVANRWPTLLALAASVVGRLDWWPTVEADAFSTLVGAMPEAAWIVPGRPAERPWHFGDAGTTLLRSTSSHDPEIWCRCDGGPHGFLSIAAHAHADALSVEMRYGGVDIFADPGTYCYHGEPEWRSYFRSTIAHNTVEVDGQNQSADGGAFLWLRHANATVIGVQDVGDAAEWIAEHDGYTSLSRPVRHRRCVRLDRASRGIDIVDEIDGGDHDLRLAFHLGPYVEAELDGHRAELRWPDAPEPGAARLELPDCLRWTLHRGETDPIMGWYSDGLGRRTPAVTLVGSGRTVPEMPLCTRLEFIEPGHTTNIPG